jgi:hypothetical protein
VRRARGAVLQEWVAFFKRPADLTVVQAKAEALLRRAGGVYEPGLPPMAQVRFTVARNEYADVYEPVRLGDPAFDSALVDAVARMARAGVEFLMPPRRDTLQMRIDIAIDPSAGLYPMPIAALAPLGTISRPAHIKPTDIYPAWPKDLEAKRVNDDVVVRILVDENGRAVMDSVKVVEGKHQGYIDAVLAVLPKYRWTPALSGGCPVKQWVQMPFMFHFAGVR